MDKQFEAFFAEATDAFRFLEHEYGYKQLEKHIESPDEGRDTTVMLTYVGAHVGIRISWYVVGGIIEVSFIKLPKAHLFPTAISFFPFARLHRAKAISLYTLAEMRGIRDDPDFLLKNVSNSRTRLKRMKMIETHMHSILAGLARATQTYATVILQGDTSMFDDVMKYHLAQQKKLDPYMDLPGDF